MYHKRFFWKGSCNKDLSKKKTKCRVLQRDCVDVTIPDKDKANTGRQISFAAYMERDAKRSRTDGGNRGGHNRGNKVMDFAAPTEPLAPIDWMTITDKQTGHQVRNVHESSLSMEVDAKYKDHTFQACGESSQFDFTLAIFAFATGFSGAGGSKLD